MNPFHTINMHYSPNFIETSLYQHYLETLGYGNSIYVQNNPGFHGAGVFNLSLYLHSSYCDFLRYPASTLTLIIRGGGAMRRINCSIRNHIIKKPWYPHNKYRYRPRIWTHPPSLSASSQLNPLDAVIRKSCTFCLYILYSAYKLL